MVTFGQGQKQDLNDLLKEAEKFHGHMGPFLVIGIRMGLVGVRELGTKENKEELCATVMVKYSVPFSCVIDGIQVATNCTIGNKKLRLRRSSSGIAARFELQNGDQVAVKVNPTTSKNVIKLLLPFLRKHSPKQLKNCLVILSPKRSKWIRTT